MKRTTVETDRSAFRRPGFFCGRHKIDYTALLLIC
jgi:hypothetical protein